MRLLDVRTLEFYEARASPPKYAVASHRWVEDGEATFDDLRSHRNRHKSGYKKVQKFADYVKNNFAGVDYVWVDTCCIDKNSSAELSEAVNSMFKWYRDADVCLAYLADVTVVDDKDGFKQSSWFRRGWTLQELLAPHLVVFLTADWQVIGHKGGHANVSLDASPPLESTIADITCIPKAVLRDYTQSYGFSLERKLGWMTGRKTTRPEDMSYGLLGIFNVSMSVIYGEGEERARKRLHTEIFKDREAIKGLLTAKGATHDSYEEGESARCLNGTRVDLLNQIYDWAEGGTDSKRIFWLCGVAGTGKSTICRTVAHHLDQKDRLGASFFFKRGEGDRSSARLLFPTIARQLASRVQGFDAFIAEALTEDRLCEKSLQHQFEKLLLQPLRALGRLTPLIIVIDALDECENDEIKMIVNLLALDSARLRIFVTSRPELPVQLGFKAIDGRLHQDITLEEVQATTIEHDIRTYFRYRFKEINENMIHESLPADWPGEGNIEALVKQASPLFIVASTICRDIEEADPQERLKAISQYKEKSYRGLDMTYLPILNRLIVGKDQQGQDDVLRGFRRLVGPIVILADTLSVSSLSNLLQTPNIPTKLRHLHSVLNVPADSDKPIRLYHLSFRDFLIDGKRTHQFSIDETQTHSMLAKLCVERLQTLRLNLCTVSSPGFKRANVSEAQIAKSIASDINYACRYWVHHLSRSQETLKDDDYVHEFLRSHFLHWLEALSWLGRLSAAISDIYILRSLVVEGEQGVRVAEFLEDARRFVLRNRHIVDIAPPQLYLSALAFAPSKSIVRQTFDNHLLNWLDPLPAVPSNWSIEIQAFVGHSDVVTAVAFSPSGRAVVSASADGTVRLWDAATGEVTRTLRGQSGVVTAVGFSPDGCVVVSASADGTQLWDTTTGEVTRTFEGHSGAVTAVSFSPDGQAVASGSAEGIWLWDATSGDVTRTLKGHSGAVAAVSFSPDGRTLASASADKMVRLWNAMTGETTRTLEGHSGAVTAVVFSPDGQTLASASEDRTVRLWNATTGKTARTLDGHGGSVAGVAFCCYRQVVASASADGTVQLWDVGTGEAMRTLKGHNRAVKAVAFSPNGRTVASASDDRTIRLWDAASCKATRILREPLLISAMAFSPDGRVVALASIEWLFSSSLTLRLWDVATGKATHTLMAYGSSSFTDELTAIAFSSDGRTLSFVTKGGTVVLLDVATGEIMRTTRIVKGNVRYVDVMAFSPNGQAIASACRDNTLQLWDVGTGNTTPRILGKCSSGFRAFAFSFDGRTIASASDDGIVQLWDTTTGDATRTLKRHTGAATAVSFSPDGRVVVSASDDMTMRLWDSATGKTTRTLEGHGGRINALAFSPDGRVVASASGDQTVRLWDVATNGATRTLVGHQWGVEAVAFSPDGKVVASLSLGGMRLWDAATSGAVEGHSNIIIAIAFSPNGRVVASASSDRTVRLWDAVTNEATRTLKGHGDKVNAIVFSPDGQALASGSSDAMVRLWDAKTGETTQTLKGHKFPVMALAFSPDGRVLASEQYDGEVRLWDAATGEAMWTLNGRRSFREFSSAVAFSPDGRAVASALPKGTVQLWDVATGKVTRVLKGHKRPVTQLASSPDGRVLASVSLWTEVRLWDVATCEAPRTLKGWLRGAATGEAMRTLKGGGVAFSPDGRVLASMWAEKVLLCDAATGEATRVLEGHSDRVTSVAFSPNGVLASASDDGTVRLWDVGTGETMRTLEVHSGKIDFDMMAFSPDGRTVAAASGYDRTVRLWDAVTGEAVRSLKGHRVEVSAVAFSPDGRAVASASADGTMRLWDPSTGAAVHVFNAGFAVRELAYSKDRMSLETDQGKLDVSRFSSSVPSESTQTLSRWRRYERRDEWITWLGQDIIWLPEEYRGPCTSHGNLLVIGQASGAVSFFRSTSTITSIEKWDSAEVLDRLLGSEETREASRWDRRPEATRRVF